MGDAPLPKPAPGGPSRVDDILLDPLFRDLLPALAPEVQGHIKEDLFKKPCDDPLVVWKMSTGHRVLLVDYERIETIKLWRLPCRVVEKTFPSQADARRFVVEYYVLRVNLTPLGVSYLRGLLYREKKQGHGGDRTSAAAQRRRLGAKSADALGERFGVNARTIGRDGKLSHALDVIGANCGEECKPKLLGWKAPLKRELLIDLSELPAQRQRKLVREWEISDCFAKFWLPKKKKQREQKAGEPDTMEVPRAPRALVEALVTKLTRRDALVVCRLLTELLGACQIHDCNGSRATERAEEGLTA